MNTERPPSRDHDDEGLEALLREVGGRPSPSGEAYDEVRAAVHAEWRAALASHARRRRRIGLGAAAGALFVTLAALAVLRTTDGLAPQIATVIHGEDGVFVAAAGGERRLVGEGEPIPRGAKLATEDGRAALRLEDGLTLRVDEHTSMRLTAADRIELEVGAVYVDADAEAQPLTIAASLGSVRHVGTQYQVRADDSRLEVLVREGEVLIAGVREVSAAAGERVRIGDDGAILRSAIGRDDAAWRWTSLAAPTFDIDDQTLDEFLMWAARETGRQLVYETREAQAAARELKLRGSIAGLDPNAALAAVLSTTRFHRRTADDAHLRIALKPAQ